MESTRIANNESTAEMEVPGWSARDQAARLEVGARTDPGRERSRNEDHYLAARLTRGVEVEAASLDGPYPDGRGSASGRLLVVADGMGGVAGGHRASALAVEAFRAFFEDGFRAFLHRRRLDEGAIHRELLAQAEQVDRLILHAAAADARLEGMGTTLTLLYAVGATAHVVHAGDSRAYVLRRGSLRQVTKDHTLVQALVDSGQITAEAARTHPNRNVVTNVLGGPGEGVDPDVFRLDLIDGDVLLICSDGLTEPVDDPTIAAVLGREPEPTRAASALVDEALARGGPDNITAVVARVRLGA